MVMGPRNLVPDREQRMFIRLLQGREVLIPGHGAALGQICYVDDQARALRMLMGNPITFGKRYNVTGRQCGRPRDFRTGWSGCGTCFVCGECFQRGSIPQPGMQSQPIIEDLNVLRNSIVRFLAS